MKKVGAVLLFVIAGMFAIVSVVSFTDNANFTTDFRIGMIVVSVLSFVLGIFVLKRKPKFRPEKKTQEHTVTPAKTSRPVFGVHLEGLSLPIGIECKILFSDHDIAIEGARTVFHLPTDKIIDMQLRHESEVQEQYVSSIGGAAAGAALFGTVGATIGGRAKKKTVVNNPQHFFYILYQKDEQQTHVSFKVNYAVTLDGIVKKYKKNGTSQGTERHVNL